MRRRSGGSASKMNLFTPIGMGPTRRESSSWSCSELYSNQYLLEDGGAWQELTMLPIRHK